MSTTADRLREARQSRGFTSAREAAIAHGWTVSTYTSHENGTRGVLQDQAVRYARAFGVSVTWLLGLSTKLDHTEPSPEEAPIMGRAAAGIWRDLTLDEHTVNVKRSTPPLRGVAGMGKFRVLVTDESVNRYIQAGEFAVCEGIDDLNALRVGALVVVERLANMLAELSVRRIDQRNGDKLTLAFASHDARFTDRIEVAPADAEIVILGVVVGRYAQIAV